MSSRRTSPDHCWVCHQRITLAGWEPFCCEVCWDSADADAQRQLDCGPLEGPLREP